MSKSVWDNCCLIWTFDSFYTLDFPSKHYVVYQEIYYKIFFIAFCLQKQTNKQTNNKHKQKHSEIVLNVAVWYSSVQWASVLLVQLVVVSTSHAVLRPGRDCFSSGQLTNPPSVGYCLHKVQVWTSTHAGVDWRSKDLTQTQQQRPGSHTLTLTWHASKYKVRKLHQRYILVC